jgi:hypothetical protein
VVKSARSCQKPKTLRRNGKRIRLPGESAISWNQQGPRGLQGLQGVQGVPGVQGVRGLQGSVGPSDAHYAHNGGPVLGPGDYIGYGLMTVDNSANATTPASFHGSFSPPSGTGATSTTPSSFGTAPGGGKVTIPLEGVFHFPNGGASGFTLSPDSVGAGGITVSGDLIFVHVGTASP